MESHTFTVWPVGGIGILQTDSLGIVRTTLERSLDALHGFVCPSHHRDLYERTQAALQYLVQPGNIERVVFVDQPTFAPICADMVPDSGVCFLRCAHHGPKDLASAMEQGRLSGDGLFVQLWDDALGVEFPAWREKADRAPALFVRLGESVHSGGSWHWAPLYGPHTAIAYPNVHAAFEALIKAADLAGETDLVLDLIRWKFGVINESGRQS
ncbi:MAG TPA: hypothetical protein VD902_03700 [Symbiobacteriaceae bacterium]|nr:hypothetical protein [Symbiobacteriaceae bacterium]